MKASAGPQLVARSATSWGLHEPSPRFETSLLPEDCGDQSLFVGDDCCSREPLGGDDVLGGSDGKELRLTISEPNEVLVLSGSPRSNTCPPVTTASLPRESGRDACAELASPSIALCISGVISSYCGRGRSETCVSGGKAARKVMVTLRFLVLLCSTTGEMSPLSVSRAKCGEVLLFARGLRSRPCFSLGLRLPLNPLAASGGSGGCRAPPRSRFPVLGVPARDPAGDMPAALEIHRCRFSA
mmetsp:Transcript_35903/g.65902  ORF Transcript_35903/g.65902 Transcript_35903/m.65902 type:complete len:242 (+) Transcript_35903:206-931(+)